MAEFFDNNIRPILALPAKGLRFVYERPVLARALLAFLLVVIFLYGLRVLKESSSSDCIICPTSRSDFDDYYRAAARLRAGKDPYNMELLRKFRTFRYEPGDLRNPKKFLQLMEFRSIGSYLYPPFTAYVLQPLTYLSYRYAAGSFQVLSFASLMAFLFVVWRRLRSDDVSFSFIASAAILVLLRFCMENFSNGNIAFFLILMCGLGLIWAWSSSRVVEFLGGALMGVAMVIKVTPAFFGLVIFSGRRWIAVVGMGFGAAFALSLPATTLGWEKNFMLLNDWRVFLIDSFREIGFIRPWANNQTVSAGIGKLFIPFSDPDQGRFGLPFFYAGGIPDASKQFFANLVRIINFVLYVLGALVALLVAWRGGRRNIGYVSDVIAVRMTFLAVLISLLGSGVSWYHAYSILLIPLIARLYQHFTLKEKLHRSEKLAIASFAFFGFGRLVFPSGFRAALSLYSVFAWIVIVVIGIYAFLALVRWSPARSEREPDSA